MRIIGQLHPLNDELEPTEKLAIARVVENLVIGVTGTIIKQYPDLFRARHAMGLDRGVHGPYFLQQ